MDIFKKREKFNHTFSIIISGIISLPFISLLFSDLNKNLYFTAGIILFTIILFICLYLIFTRKYRRRKKILKKPFPDNWKTILKNEVIYYQKLNDDEKNLFQKHIQIFLDEKTITGIDTDVDDKCKILVAVSAIIPIFKLPGFEYDHLREILIYPGNFDENYVCDGNNQNILGLVDSSTTMILSKPSLYSGFKNATDKLNVGIHEFAHKIDGEDGNIDGIPSYLMTNYKLLNEWQNIYQEETKKIKKRRSDINSYALTNEAEFFAVVSEYFFENPGNMLARHKKLYNILKKIYRQDTFAILKGAINDMFYHKRGWVGKRKRT